MKIRALRTYGRLFAASVLAIVAAYVAQVSFIRHGNFAPGLLIVAVVAFVVIATGRQDVGTPETRNPVTADLVALVLFLSFGAAMRLWDLGHVPEGVWFDEAQNGLVSNRILTEAAYKPIYIGDLTQLPALFFYYIALFIAILGPNILAVRLAAATLGILTIPLLYLLGRELYGPRIGLLAAALLAVNRTHINFSRFGMNGISAPFFLVLTLYLTMKAVRTGRTACFVGAGVSLGLGLYSYLAFNVVPVLLAFWLIHYGIVHKLWRRPEILRPAAIGIFTVFVVVAPLAGFAIRNSDVFSQRASTVSLFKNKTIEQSKEAFLSNLTIHAEMFNFRGDNNGRHNLPGEPMLDNLSAALFLVGIAIALARSKSPAYSILSVGLVLMMLPGILSLDFEAPQFYRTIGVIPIVCLLVAIALGQPYLTFVRWVGQSRNRVMQVGLLAVVGWIGYSDATTYWTRQVTDFAAWTAFSIPETIIGREIVRLGPDTVSYVDGMYNGLPTEKFLAPKASPITFDIDQLPFQKSSATVVFLSDRNQTWTGVLRRMYPGVQVTPFHLPDGSPTILYEVNLPKAALDASRGLSAQYFEGTERSDRPAFARTDPSIDFDWSEQQPLKLPFTVAWSGVVAAPTSGAYLFKVEGATPNSFSIDGTRVGLDPINLAEGSHIVDLTVTVAKPLRLQLLWTPPARTEGWEVVPSGRLLMYPEAGRGLQGSYFPNAIWSGSPTLLRIDPEISTHYHLVPVPQPFSVEWVGKIDIPIPGIYRFGSQSVDASWISIDGKTLVTNDRKKDRYVEGAVTLDPGLHDIQIKFVDESGYSFIDVFWTPPGQGRSHLPGDRLFPPRAAYAERAGALVPPTDGATPPVAATPAAIAPPVGSPAYPQSGWKLAGTIEAPPGAPWSFSDPRDVAVDARGEVFVADAGAGDVVKLGPDGAFIQLIGSKGEAPGQFQSPVSLVIDPRDQLVVLDAENGRIQTFTLDGVFQGIVGGAAPPAFYHPRSIAVDARGQYYVADTGTGRLAILSPSGAVVKELKRDAENSQILKQPVGVAVAPSGAVLLTDAETSHLSWYDASLHLIKTWQISPFDSVRHAQVLFLSDNSWYQSDPNGHRVVHFDSAGNPFEQLGGSQGELAIPMGMASDAAGKLYVADVESRRIAIYSPP